MPYPVTVSVRAEKNLYTLISYLESNWSTRVRDNFLAVLRQKVNQISEMPLMYPSSGKKENIRRCVITPQTTLYYQIKDDQVEIITIQDSRQDPGKLKI